MLHVIHSLTDPLITLVNDDPVRPEIPLEFRVSDHSEILVLQDDNSKPLAVVCVLYANAVPRSIQELLNTLNDELSVAVFYTIWSYAPGAGRKLINAARQHIETHFPTVTKFVTLSPQTEMARVFHLRNGASVLNVNADSINYCY